MKIKINIKNKEVQNFKTLFKTEFDEDEVDEIDISIENINFIQESGLSDFIQQISAYKNIKIIYLTINQQIISKNVIQSLANVIQNLNQLNMLHLTFKDKILLAAEYNILFSSISDSLSIEYVEISAVNSEIDLEECQIIQRCVKNSKSLIKLQLSVSQISFGLIEYYILRKEVPIQISVAIDNINFTDEKGLSYLISPLTSFKNLDSLSLSFDCPQINQVSIDQQIQFSSIFNHQFLMQQQQDEYQLQKQEKQLFLEFLQQFKNLKSFFFQIDQSFYLIYFPNSTNSITGEIQKIDVEISDFNFTDNNILFELFVSPFQQYEICEHLSFKIQQQFSLDEKQADLFGQAIQQFKSIKILLQNCQINQNTNKLLSEQLSQLENLRYLKFKVFYDNLDEKIDASIILINEITKNKYIQELDLKFSYLEQNTNFQEWAEQFSSMISLKKITLGFYECKTVGRAIDFFLNLNKYQQSQLKQIKLKFYFQLTDQELIDLAVHINFQNIIYSLEITFSVGECYEFEKYSLFFKQLTTINILVLRINLVDCLETNQRIEAKNNLYLEYKKKLLKMKRIVNLSLD